MAKETNRPMGRVAGQPVRFVNGHNARLQPIRSVAERFWEKVEKQPGDGCRLWTASKNSDGYGHIKINGQWVRAHVVSWELAHPGQPIPPETPHVLHKCDTPACVRPDHLWLGTNDDNVRDKMAKGRQARGERIGIAKLTEAAVLEVRRLHAEEGLGYRRLARRFGFNRSTVRDILSGRSWAWLKVVA